MLDHNLHRSSKPDRWLITPSTNHAPTPPRVTAMAWLGLAVLAIAVAAGIVAAVSITRPSCATAATWIETISVQEKAGKWAIAADNAQTALTTDNLCEGDRLTLANMAVSDMLQGLSATAINSADLSAQQTAVDSYENIKRFAKEQGVGVPKSPYQVAEAASVAGQFLLAKLAFEEALAQGDVATIDQSQARFYHSILYNLGWWWPRAKSGNKFQDGLALLSAADQVDRRWKLSIGLAGAELRQLIVGDANWPPPAQSALLDQNPIQ